MTNLPFEPVIEIGFGSGPFDPDPAWVDVTEYMLGSGDGPSIGIKRGRRAESNSISPGSASFVFDNTGDTFNPDNASGPFFGELDPFVPVRIRMGTETLFRGVVEAWPVVDTDGQATVEVELLDPFGMLASIVPPESAFAVESRLLEPSKWWRSAEGTWTEWSSGATATTRGTLHELDALVDGDSKAWGSKEGDGQSINTNPWASFDMDQGQLFLSLWVKPEWNGETGGQVVLQQHRIEGWVPAIRVSVGVQESGWAFNNIWFWAENCYVNLDHLHQVPDRQDGSWVGSEMNFAWGETVHLAVQFPNLETPSVYTVFLPWHPETNIEDPEYPRVWINGVEFKPSGHISNTLNGLEPLPGLLPLYLGAGPEPGWGFSGAVDHIQWWERYEGNFDDGAELARRLYNSGRRAWAGQSLDERTTAILAAVGADALINDFDRSSIRTRHGYRPDPILDLLQRIEDTEQGRIWVDKDGMFRFSHRQWAWNNPRSVTLQATLTDDIANVGGTTYLMDPAGLVRIRDSRRITTVAQVTSEHGRMQTVEASPEIIERYGRRNTIHLSRLLHHSDEMSRSIAEWIIMTRSTPKTRVEQVRILVDPLNSDMVEFAQTVDECDLIAVERSGETTRGHVIGVEHSITTGGWWVTLHLDEGLVDRDWFKWNESRWNFNQSIWAF